MKQTNLLFSAFMISTIALSSAWGQGTPPPIPLSAGPGEETMPAPATNTEAETAAPAGGGFVPSTRKVIPAPAASRNEPASRLQTFEFAGADLDTVLTMYCEWTGKTYLKVDTINASISLKVDKKPVPVCIKLVEAILAMNNIALIPMGDDVIKVVQANSGDLTGQGGPVSYSEETEYEGNDRLVSQLIPLKNVQIQEVQTAIQHLMHSYGKIQTIEASNSLLITDTESNIQRIRELVEFVDKASAKIEPRFYEIIYAEATDLASKLNEIITMAQSDQKTGTRATTSRAAPPGVIRARSTTAQQPAVTQATISSSEAGERLIIQGSVKVMADERTNLILIFSQKENFEFFDNIIKTLDVVVEPAVTFEVVNLEYADAEELSGTLNSLIGSSSSGTTRSSASGTTSSAASRARGGTSSSTSTSSRNTSNRSSGAMVVPNADPASEVATFENLNDISENTKILADTRSNSLLLMGRKGDIAAIKKVIESLDVMLEQVMIEADIFEIGLTKGLDHGIQWLYQTQGGDKLGAWDVGSLATNGLKNAAASALKYYQNVSGINTELAIKVAASDNNARVLGTPIIMTTDNTEATLSIGEQRPVVTSTSSYANSSGTQSSTYEYKDIGIQLTVTPRINPQRFVVMEISQQADQLGGTVSIDNNDVPIILNRQFEASVAIPDRGTIALGGLMTTEVDDSVSKIPILGDIPLLGRYLFSSVHKSEVQRELLVLLTPYVMTNHEELLKETERVYRKTSLQPGDWNWSESKLRDIPSDER